MSDGARTVELGRIERGSAGATSRITARVDDAEVFVESDDVELAESAELLTSAFLPAVVQRGWRLRVERPLDPEWLDGVAGILRTWAEWWGTEDDLGKVLDAPRGEPGGPPVAATGMCFSGGVDSFHALLHSHPGADYLVTALGYDMRFDDVDRFKPADAALREVAAEVGARPIVIRTNLKHTRPILGSGWGRVHGGALAALGHACAAAFGELKIAATHHASQAYAWGSSPRTDPGWSSSRTRILHVGNEFTRVEKLRALLDDSLVRRHIRVCWENRAASGNCGECEKCVRTMLQIHVFGGNVEEWPFAGEGTLAERVNELESVHPQQVPSYEPLIDRCHDPRLRSAIVALTERAHDPYEDRRRLARRREARRAVRKGP